MQNTFRVSVPSIIVVVSFEVAHNWIRRRGRESINDFLRLCNEGKSLAYLAHRFGVSIQRVSVLRKQLFERVWVFNEGTLDALKFERAISEDAVQDIDETLEGHHRLVAKTRTPILKLNGSNHRA